MSKEADGLPEVPLFGECVLGYRAWRIDKQGRLWPINDWRTAWEPGVNVARCNCAVRGALAFDWSWRDGRRVLEPHPQHVAPAEDCTCGLYSWRRPRGGWHRDPRFASGTWVCGAVASWGRIQVHAEGFRAEKACVVTLAYPRATAPEALSTLERVAARYGVELVALEGLEEAARRHGSPLPDALVPESPPETVATAVAPPRGPDREAAARPSADPERRTDQRSEREPVPVRERAGIGLVVVGGGMLACGGLMCWGRGVAALIGLALVVAGSATIAVATWWLQPHGAAKRALQARNRRLQRQSKPVMTEAEFEAIEDALDSAGHRRTASNVGPRWKSTAK